jgi:methylphosphotriester-DNA--protein-cysteine methyltransferase
MARLTKIEKEEATQRLVEIIRENPKATPTPELSKQTELSKRTITRLLKDNKDVTPDYVDDGRKSGNVQAQGYKPVQRGLTKTYEK